MADVFISYSRQDNVFVRRLFDQLAQQGKDIWVDWEDIPVSANWWSEICHGIESANTFIFVVSRASTASPVCNFEVNHALTHNKRIIPIVYQDVNEFEIFEQIQKHRLTQGELDILGQRDLLEVARASWKAISHHNWLFFRNESDFEANFAQLLQILDTDLDYVRMHTRLLVRAREWESENRRPGLLLTATETSAAESWQAQGAQKQPHPTALHYEYIHASRLKHRQNQRRLLIGVSAALGVMVILSIISLLLYQQSQTNYQLAVTAQEQAVREADRAETQAAIAIENAATATIAQGEALIQADNAATQAAIAIENAATATIAQGEALIQADNAATQAAIAIENAATATIAQGEALIQADIAATQAAIAIENAATATIAQGEALIQAETAIAAQATSRANAELAATQAAIAGSERDRAQSIALAAQSELELSGSLPERAVLLAESALLDYGYSWQAERALGLAVANTLSPVTIRRNNGAITAIAASADGQRVFSGDRSGNLVWVNRDGTSGLTVAAHRGAITSLSVSPDGRLLLATAADGSVSVWDVDGNALFRVQEHRGSVNGAVWSADGSRFLTYGADQRALIFDAANGDLLATLAHDGAVNSADWSDGGLIVTGADDRLVRVWSAEGDLLRTLEGHRDRVRLVTFSPDGAWIASGGALEEPAVHIWSTQSGETRTILRGHMLPIARIVWSPDGRSLAVVDNRLEARFTRTSSTARVWDLASEETRFTVFAHTNFVLDVAWSPDSQRVATVGGEGSLFLWDATSGGELLGIAISGGFQRLLWTQNGDALVTGSDDGVLRIFPMWANTADLLDYARDCCTTRILTGEEARQFGLATATSVPAPAEIASCPAILPSRLFAGVWGRVVADGDPAPVNVRNLPQLNSTVIRQIPPDQTFYVLEGPICADTIAWFRVRFGLNATEGWIAEGLEQDYFVQPDQP